jgi:hypothetical protein
MKPEYVCACRLSRNLGLFRSREAVGGTPTGAVETTALPSQTQSNLRWRGNQLGPCETGRRNAAESKPVKPSQTSQARKGGNKSIISNLLMLSSRKQFGSDFGHDLESMATCLRIHSRGAFVWNGECRWRRSMTAPPEETERIGVVAENLTLSFPGWLG